MSSKSLEVLAIDGEIAEVPADTYGVWRAWWAMVIFEVQILAVGIDIAIVTLLVHPIEAAFRISDVTFAMITTISLGIGIAASYYPAGLLADTFRRRDVLAAGSVIWMLAAFVAARSDSVTMLFVARFLAGVGIGVTGPAVFSMISDAFPRTRRAFPLGAYTVGISLGLGIGLTTCGFLVDAAQRNGMLHIGGILLSPWQQCFLGVAAIGVISLALILTIHEPPRLERATNTDSHLNSTLRLFGQYMRRHWLLWVLILLGYSLSQTGYYAIAAWGPAFGARHYGVSGVSAIALLGTFTAIGSVAGSVGGGLLAQRGINHGNSRVLPGMLVGISVISIAFAFFPYMPSWLLAVVGVAGVNTTARVAGILAFVAIQETAPNEVRGQLVGLFGFIGFLPQMLGATTVASLASSVFAKTGGLGPALAVVCAITSVLAVLLFAFCGATYERAKREMGALVAASQPE